MKTSSEMVNLVLLLITSVFILKSAAIEIEIQNKENDTIWVTFEGTGKSKAFEQFALESGRATLLNTSSLWTGFIWARTHCDNSTGNCLTGHCGDDPKCNDFVANSLPYSYAVLKSRYGTYSYAISFSRGFNLPISVKPIGGNEECYTLSCKQHLNDACPPEYILMHENTAIGCHSPCTLHRSEEYCCFGKYAEGPICRDVTLPETFVKFFSSRCRDGLLGTQDLFKHTCQKARKFIVTFGVLVPISRN